jgi:preprotein translocase subunit SecD
MKLHHCLSLAAVLFTAGCDRVKNSFGSGDPQSFKGGTTFVLRLQPTEDPVTGEKRPITKLSLDHAISALSNRVKTAGVRLSVVTAVEDNCITVQSPRLAPEELDAVRNQLQQEGKLDFRMVDPDSEMKIRDIEAKMAIRDPAWTILKFSKKDNPEMGDRKLLVHRVPDITGNHIKSASARYDLQGWHVCLEFDKAGGDKFFEITRAMRKNVDRFAVVFDHEIISAPTTQVEGGIAGGSCIISGKYTEKSAREFANALMNPLENPVKIEEERTIAIPDAKP